MLTRNLVELLNGSIYQSFCTVISTYFMMCYDQLSGSKLSGSLQATELNYVIRLLDSLTASASRCPRDECFKKAVTARIREW